MGCTDINAVLTEADETPQNFIFLNHELQFPVTFTLSTHLSIKLMTSRSHCILMHNKEKKTPWSESASELYRPSDRHLSAKWLPTFAEKGCHVVSVKDRYGRSLGFLDKSRYFSIK
jgi:hypothetical protein